MFWEKFRKKFVKFANYSSLIRSKFGQPNNVTFGSTSQKKMNYSSLIHECCDYATQYSIIHKQLITKENKIERNYLEIKDKINGDMVSIVKNCIDKVNEIKVIRDITCKTNKWFPP